MGTFVLIHGGWAGGWCWEKLAALLTEQGHVVVTPDLPGHGEDKTPVSEITLQSYVDCVSDLLDSQSDPVILVGHSSGGVVITQTTEQRPENVRALVYLCAYLPGDGESLFFWAQQELCPERNLLRFLEFSPDQTYAMVKQEGIRPALLHDCTEEDARWFEARIDGVREPFAPPMTPVHVTPEKYGRIPRFYIETLQDCAISPALQKQMYTAHPCEVISMNTSHSPHLSQPQELVNHLVAIAGAVTL
jgi:pimeloyl-ACP methyl ester carboxylesterase